MRVLPPGPYLVIGYIELPGSQQSKGVWPRGLKWQIIDEMVTVEVNSPSHEVNSPSHLHALILFWCFEGKTVCFVFLLTCAPSNTFCRLCSALSSQGIARIEGCEGRPSKVKHSFYLTPAWWNSNRILLV